MDQKAWARLFDPGSWQHAILRAPWAFSGLALIVALAAIATAAGLGAFASSRLPQSMQILGYAGHLGEWELTATLSRHDPGAVADLAGPMKMKHVGMCSKDGPDEKTGAMQIRLSRWSSRFNVKMMIDGIECTHSGDLSDAYIGTMVCPDRKAVPLTLWTK